MSKNLSKINILILDDEIIIQKELKEFLEIYNYNVVAISTPEEAKSQLNQQSFDILILDIKLPGISGLELLPQFKKDHPFLEVIMITGHGDNDAVIEAMKNGAFDFFHKPINGLEVKSSIERTKRLVQSHRQISRLKDINQQYQKELSINSEGLIGNSDSFKKVLDLISKSASSLTANIII